MEDLNIIANDLKIFVGKDGQGFRIMEIDYHNQYANIEHKVVDDDNDIYKFLDTCKSTIMICKDEIADKKFHYSNKLVNGGGSSYRDFERKAHDSLKVLQTDFNRYSDIIIDRISSYTE